MSELEYNLKAPANPPADVQAESYIISCILLGGGKVADVYATELRLSARHFWRESYGRMFDAALAIYGRGGGIDHETIRYEIEQRHGKLTQAERAELELVVGAAPDPGNFREYGRRVVELADWRGRLQGVYGQLAAIARMDEQAYRDAVATDELATAGHEGLLTPEALGLDWLRWMNSDGSDAIPTPWPKINAGLFGGLRPGDTTIMAGWSGMGKSTGGDDILDFAKKTKGANACLYPNEMSHIDRVSRLLSSRARVPFRRIMEKNVTPEDARKLLAAARDLPFAMQPCAGWSADAIARHLRRFRWDLAFIDLGTRIPAQKTSDWDHVSGVLADAARQSGTHVIIAVQLNRERATGPVRPMPVLRDLRNTGAWEQDARNVLLLHRREELDPDTGTPVTFDDGVIQLAKVSNGQQGATERVFLDYAGMRFLPINDTDTITDRRADLHG